MKVDINAVTEKDFRAFAEMSVIDCHTHIMQAHELDTLAQTQWRWGMDRFNVMAVASYGERYKSNNLLALLLKRMNPGRVYAFGSLWYPPEGAPEGGETFLRQAQRLIALGCDGMKMMEGKPDVRRRIGIPLDSPVYDAYFSWLEERRIPLLYHVNDPKIYWDKDNVPQYVIDLNWAYLDGSFQSKEGIYAEIEGILNKHPRLRVIFAHFYFMDEESIERASAFLDRWPEVSFDLAPGLMFTSFAKDTPAWREFFLRYPDRILFGTDNDYGRAKELIYAIRTVLETDNELDYWDATLHGMRLPEDALRKIYRGNFQRYAGEQPKPVDDALLLEECGRAAAEFETSPERDALLGDIAEVKKRLGAL